MKTIPLTQGKVAMVDDEDFDELNKHRWCAINQRHRWYATRFVKSEYGYRHLKMHQQIIGLTHGKDIDHINHNGLDNRKCNLRICSRSQNKMNTIGYKRNTSGLIGVSWENFTKKWRAQICKDGKKITIGRFNNKIRAGIAYDKKALELFGEFATLNFFVLSLLEEK